MKALLPRRLKVGETVSWTDRKTKTQCTITIGAKYYDCKNDDTLNSLQKAHINGEIDLYMPIEGYSQKYKTIFNKNGEYESAEPIGEPKRNDLPPVYMQWKQDYTSRFLSNKESKES